MAIAPALLGNRFGFAGQNNFSNNIATGIGNTINNDQSNNFTQNTINNDSRTINNIVINLNEAEGGEKACKGGKGKGKGKAKGCKGGKKGHHGKGPQGPQSPQQMMLKMMSMMLKLMGQMQGGGGSALGGSPPGVNVNIGGFRPPGFLG